MSQIESIKIAGKQDLGAITPEELLHFCIEYGVERINSMFCLYEASRKEDGYVVHCGIEEATELSEKGFEIRQLNEWQIDFN